MTAKSVDMSFFRAFRRMSTFPQQQRVIQITQNGPPSVLVPSTVPLAVQELKSNQILVKNEYIGVNFIDTYHRSGLYKVQLPFVLGREASGTIAALGQDVESTGKFKVGDRVAYISPSTYAEYTICGNNDHVIGVPESLSSHVAAACLLQGLTAYSFITRAYNVQQGDWVLVFAAAGGVGQWLVQLLKERGAHVLAVVSSEKKAELVRALGIEHLIITGRRETTDVDQQVVDKVMACTGGAGVQAVYDGIGRATFNTSLTCCAYEGRLVSFGNSSGKVDPLDIVRLSARNVVLMRPTVMNYLRQPSSFTDMASDLLELVNSGKVKVHVHNVWPLEHAKAAHEAIESGGTVGKLLLKP